MCCITTTITSFSPIRIFLTPTKLLLQVFYYFNTIILSQIIIYHLCVCGINWLYKFFIMKSINDLARPLHYNSTAL